MNTQRLNRLEAWERYLQLESRAAEIERALPEAARYGFRHEMRQRARVDAIDAEMTAIHSTMFQPTSGGIYDEEPTGPCCDYCGFRFADAREAWDRGGVCWRCLNEDTPPTHPSWTPIHDYPPKGGR